MSYVHDAETGKLQPTPKKVCHRRKLLFVSKYLIQHELQFQIKSYLKRAMYCSMEEED